MKQYVLDANALFRFLMREPGSETVGKLIREARDKTAEIAMAMVNWGEVYYNIAKRDGLKEAISVMDRVSLLPIDLCPADKPLTVAAAKLKLSYGLAYTDCFAAALAGEKKTLITSDVKDFRRVPGLKVLPLPELRRKQ